VKFLLLGLFLWPVFLIVQIKNNMRQFNLFLMMLVAATLTSCEAIGDIFGAGFYTGIFVVIFVVVLIIVLISRIFRR
jgi:hypothetical protein